MTKRFVPDERGFVYDIEAKDYISDIFALLNELVEENEQLKQKIKSINEILTKDMDYVESFEKIEEILK